jgi:hypothetical protein
MFARGLASLAPGPIGAILSQVGKTKPTLDTSPTYDPAKDPNSPEYKGPGYFGNLTNFLTGGAGTQISDKVSEEISSLFDGIEFLNKPTNDKDITTSGIGTVNKEVTDNAVNNVVSSNLPVQTQAMLNVLNKDPSKLKAFEFMAKRPGISSYQGAKQALDIYNKNTI